MTYKFLLFDLDHTLLDFDTSEDVALTQLLKEEGVADIQAYTSERYLSSLDRVSNWSYY